MAILAMIKYKKCVFERRFGMNRILRNTGFYLLIFLVTVGIIHFISNQNDTKDTISYTKFRQVLAENNVESVTVRFADYTYLIQGTYKTPVTDKKNFETNAF